MNLNLYLISAPTTGWDVYSEAVVAAKNEEDAATIHPDGTTTLPCVGTYYGGSWVGKPEKVTVVLVGKAIKGTKRGVVCASFHAG